jgi:hypothetical protein
METIAKVRYKQFSFDAQMDFSSLTGTGYAEEQPAVLLTIATKVPSVDTGETIQISLGMRLIPEGYDTEERLVEVLFQTIVDIETHEAKEWFTYKGVQLHNPHPESQPAPREVPVYKIWDDKEKRWSSLRL